MARFTGIPSLPQSGLDDAQYRLLSALKENVELLIGSRGERDFSSKAVTVGAVSASSVPAGITNLSARGAGFTISGQTVPSLADYTALLRDVQTLVNDVNTLRGTLNTLLVELKR